jgi:hypothetical protein
LGQFIRRVNEMKKIILVFVLVLAFVSSAFAAGKIRPLNIFPYMMDSVDVPLYPQNIEELCTTDISGTVCEVNSAGGNSVTKDIPYSGNITYSGTATYSGTVPFTLTAYVYGYTECLDDALIDVPTCTTNSKHNCCEKQVNYKGQVYIICWDIKPEDINERSCYPTYTKISTTFDVPYAGTVPYSGSVAYSGTTQCQYKEYGPSDVIFQEGNVDLQCPSQDEVPTQTVQFKDLVTNACVGETIQVEATGYAWAINTVRYRIVVRYFKPGSPNYTVVLRTDKEQAVVDGNFYDSIEGGFTFTKPGTYSFIFRVFKPDGTLGESRTRSVAVQNCSVAE